MLLGTEGCSNVDDIKLCCTRNRASLLKQMVVSSARRYCSPMIHLPIGNQICDTT